MSAERITLADVAELLEAQANGSKATEVAMFVAPERAAACLAACAALVRDADVAIGMAEAQDSGWLLALRAVLAGREVTR